jgi:hypothetical protein
MTGNGTHLEALLREALAPVEPPEDLAVRLEQTLVNLKELAHDELESWELGAMRDPRNWARPAAAIVIGAGAGSALVVLQMRNRARARAAHARWSAAPGLRELTSRTLGEVAGDARRLFPRRAA